MEVDAVIGYLCHWSVFVAGPEGPAYGCLGRPGLRDAPLVPEPVVISRIDGPKGPWRVQETKVSGIIIVEGETVDVSIPKELVARKGSR